MYYKPPWVQFGSSSQNVRHLPFSSVRILAARKPPPCLGVKHQKLWKWFGRSRKNPEEWLNHTSYLQYNCLILNTVLIRNFTRKSFLCLVEKDAKVNRITKQRNLELIFPLQCWGMMSGLCAGPTLAHNVLIRHSYDIYKDVWIWYGHHVTIFLAMYLWFTCIKCIA